MITVIEKSQLVRKRFEPVTVFYRFLKIFDIYIMGGQELVLLFFCADFCQRQAERAAVLPPHVLIGQKPEPTFTNRKE